MCCFDDLDLTYVYYAVDAIIAFYVLKFLLTAISSFYAFFLRPAKNLKTLGDWAVVTGATDGIGLEYARQLAAQQINVFLVSRDEKKLEATKEEICEQYGVEVDFLAADLSVNDSAMYENIKEKLQQLDIGVLVNNVGMSYNHPDFIENVSDERVDAMMNLNITTVNKFTSIVLPMMKNKKKGAIVNVGSAAGVNPSALLAYYSASKSYVNFFSQSIAYESKKDNVFVQSLMPLFVVSKLSKIRKPSLFTPLPSTYVKSAMKTIGYDTYTHGYWAHALQLWIVSLLPSSLVDAQLFGMHMSLRKRALKKAAQKKE
eukprot:m.26015 g.26015  ORF g.26015 m.26015 type:complete len:315 (-) comp9228_c0_seq1:149-1093(-)